MKSKASTPCVLTIFIVATLASLSACSRLPQDFVWGVASAAYQIEGAWNEDGRGPSIWDIFSTFPGRIANNETGHVADDFYHLYPEDIAIMQGLGLKHFRLSISWSRVLPNGTVNLDTLEGVNQAGVEFYNDLFDALLAAGIEPWVTLYHWDLPEALNDKTSTGGWLNPNIVHRFNEYAEFCFKTFGDKVKHWITLNEIVAYSTLGYGSGAHAPGRCSPDVASWCEEIGGGGNSSTEPYIVTHHSLLSHALAVRTYRTKYQRTQNGVIGLAGDVQFTEPYDPNNPDDVAAVETNTLFKLGWIYDPIFFGKYPDVMRELITGDRLPTFNESMSELIKGSIDFLGLNHYTTHYVRHTGIPGNTWSNDGRYEETSTNVDGTLIGPLSASDWLRVYPLGFRKVLNFISKRYDNPPLYVFENGVSVPGESYLPLEQALNDTFRVNYLKNYISNMIQAITVDNVNVKGYFLWSILDNFEWIYGYDVRFGIVYVDYDDNLKRHIKRSARWYSNLITNPNGDEMNELLECEDSSGPSKKEGRGKRL